MAGGQLPFGFAPSGALTTYTPTLRERATDWLRTKLFTDDREGQQKAGRMMDVASYTPFGFATDLYDAGREGAQGNYGGAALTLGMAGLPGPSPKKIRAFHGSPHDFDRFDMSKIGTGEGAQAYGHGLYFAENEGVARGYRDTLARQAHDKATTVDNTVTMNGQAIDASHPDFMTISGIADKGIDAEIAAAKARLQQRIDVGIPEDSPLMRAGRNVLAKLEKYRGADIKGNVTVNEPEFNPGRMYEVEIAADPESFLDWDKPLSEQPEAVVSALKERLGYTDAPFPYSGLMGPKSMLSKDAMGEEIYRAVGKERGDGKEAAAVGLREAGIPGIKYLDAGSRSAGDGTRNYVVFDDKLVSIVRKYGIAGASAMLGYNILDGMDEAQAAELKRIEGNQ